MQQPKIITAAPLMGILGGMGPLAGVDLHRKIILETQARDDGDHFSVIHLSFPAAIQDRSAFLLGNTAVNPAETILHLMKDLAGLGAKVVGMPCNTAHAPAILDGVLRQIATEQPDLIFVHMIEAVARFIRRCRPNITRIGLLTTTGTHDCGIYDFWLRHHGLKPIKTEKNLQENLVQTAIYDRDFGIKARQPYTAEARRRLLKALNHLQNQGAELVILGCSELPLALPESHFNGLELLDATLILARAMIAAAAPQRLKNRVHRETVPLSQ